MARTSLSLLLLGAQCIAAANEDEPHYHNGKLAQYDIGPPSVLLSTSDEAKLRTGKPIMQAVQTDIAGSRRMVMVQEIAAPSNIVMGRIMDLEKYDRMVDGVDSVVNYVSAQEGNRHIVKSTYDISVLHMKFKYFIKHTYDPQERCMVFHLDYDKRSDIDDSVGYWYVLPNGRANSRVYYSCECKLRGWVPGPVYTLMTKEAMRKATTWVSAESLKEWRTTRHQNPREQLSLLVNNVRESIDQLKLTPPQPPIFVNNWVNARKRAAVRFVSAGRPPMKGSNA
mmetsp:Transcript_36319/g.77440  ORF Transcript_36319/g.77440 Transcript_36319/m.77440 type:complete len:282 (-) Transcript_36319:94-939(-)